MKHLTDGQTLCCMCIAVGAIIFLAGGYCINLKKMVRDIIREEKAKLRAWAVKYAEQLARQRVREIISHLQITVDVQLINESDIAWGRDSIRQHSRKDDAA